VLIIAQRYALIQLMYRWLVSIAGTYIKGHTARRGDARFRESEVNVPGSGYKHQGLAGGLLLSLSLSLSFSPGQTQVAGRLDNARSLDKAPLIVPISDEEWTAGLPLTISFVICIRLIKITMSAKPRRCRAARRWPAITGNDREDDADVTCLS